MRNGMDHLTKSTTVGAQRCAALGMLMYTMLVGCSPSLGAGYRVGYSRGVDSGFFLNYGGGVVVACTDEAACMQADASLVSALGRSFRSATSFGASVVSASAERDVLMGGFVGAANSEGRWSMQSAGRVLALPIDDRDNFVAGGVALTWDTAGWIAIEARINSYFGLAKAPTL